MKKLLMACACALMVFAACEKDDEGQSIVGKWSCVDGEDQIGDDLAIVVHFNFKENGTYELIIPHWEEKRFGKYTVSGNTVNFETTKLEWLWDRNSGYENVYDQYECYSDKPHWEERTPYADPFGVWKRTYPEEAKFAATYKFDKKGYLHFELTEGFCPGQFEGIFYKDPKYEPKPYK